MSNKTFFEQIIEKIIYLSFIAAVQIVPIMAISNIAAGKERDLKALNQTSIFTYDVFQTTASYTLVILALTIISYLLLETVTKKKINYFQYFLIGASISVNLLLNLSIGEFLGFIPAFVISAAMTIFLNTLFTGLFSQDFTNPSIIFLTLTIFYGGLFFYIQSTDYNLLVTSILSFVTVTILMIGSTMIQKK